mgnify:FL=1
MAPMRHRMERASCLRLATECKSDLAIFVRRLSICSMDGIMTRLLLVLALAVGTQSAFGQAPRERISKLQDLLRTAHRGEDGSIVVAPRNESRTNASQPPGAIAGDEQAGVSISLSDQVRVPTGVAVEINSPGHAGVRGSEATQALLPPGVEIPETKIPLPRTYHGRGPAGAGEPDLGRRGEDPWDLARRLGIADNASYPIPESMRHDDLIHQTPRGRLCQERGMHPLSYRCRAHAP